MVDRVGSQPDAPGDARGADSGRQLRLALAMRGGVSLAVWIGGACAELEALRRSDERTASRRLYAQLLGAAGYTSVQVDVLTGASAGGLNAVVLATALMYGVEFDDCRELWLELADLGALVRPGDDPRPLSLLRGDEYLLAELRRQLRALIAAVPDGRRGPHTADLDLHLAATMVEPAEVPVVDDWGETYSELNHRATFRFRHNRYTSDFHAPPGAAPAAPPAATAARLALAARSTASFPGFFEPATLRVHRPERIGDRSAGDDPDAMSGVFSDASAPRRHVLDGGVLDNIPVAQAVQSIAASSAGGPTERWLLYLHPSPDAQPQPGEGVEAVPDLLQTVLSTARANSSAQSVLNDLGVLRAHNADALRYRTTRRALLGHVRDAGGFTLSRERRREYARQAAGYQADRVRQLLEDPARLIGEDPFTSVAERWPLGAGDPDAPAWDASARSRLQAELERQLQADLAGPAGDLTPLATPEDLSRLGLTALSRAIGTLIAAVRALEATGRAAGSPGLAALGQLKERLYALGDVAGLLRHMGDLFWPAYAARRRPPAGAGLAGWVRDAIAARQAFVASGAGDASPGAAFAYLEDELARRWQRLAAHADGGAAPAAGEGRQDRVAQLWRRAVDELVCLAGQCVGLPTPPGAGDPADDDQEAESRLVCDLAAHVRDGGPPEAAHARSAEVLATIEALTLPLAMSATSPPEEVRFLRVAGTNRSPLERHFPGGRVELGDKLTGNQLRNFAAFYDPSWRANDWMWGRLDAATSLIAVLLRPAALRRGFPEPGESPEAAATRLVERVARLVTAAPEPPHRLDDSHQRAWREHFAGLWEEARGDVRDEVVRLFGGDGVGLGALRDVLVARRHWELLLSELPAVVQQLAGVDVGDPGWHRHVGRADRRHPLTATAVRLARAGRDPLRHPQGMTALLGEYRLGSERIADDLCSERFRELSAGLLTAGRRATEAALAGYPAAAPLRRVGPLLPLAQRALLFRSCAPRWVQRLVLAGAAAAVTRTVSSVWSRCRGTAGENARR